MFASAFRGVRFVSLGVALGLGVLAPRAEAFVWVPVLEQDFSVTNGLERWSYTGATLSGHDLFRVQGNELQADWDAGAGLNRPTITTSYFSAPLGLTLTAADTFRVRAQLRVDALHTRDFYEIANFGLFNPSAMGQNRTFVDGGGDTPRNLVEFNYWITPTNAYGSAQIGPTAISSDEVWSYNGTDTQLGENLLPGSTALYVELVYNGGTRLTRTTIYSDSGYSTILSVGGVAMEEWTSNPLAGGENFALTDVGFFNYVAAADWGSGAPLDGVGGTGAFQNVTVEMIPEPGVASLLLAGLAGLVVRRLRAA